MEHSIEVVLLFCAFPLQFAFAYLVQKFSR